MIRINTDFFYQLYNRDPYPKEKGSWEFADQIDGTWEFEVYNEYYEEASRRAIEKFGFDRDTGFGEIALVGNFIEGE